MNMRNEISLKEVQENAEVLYRKGFSCSESVVGAIRDSFELDISQDTIALATGFSGGIGKAGCTCGALSGGVMALGIFFGRTRLEESTEVCHRSCCELHDYFKEETGKNTVCCRVLTRGLNLSKGEHKSKCVHYVGIVAYKVAEIVLRECPDTSNK